MSATSAPTTKQPAPTSAPIGPPTRVFVKRWVRVTAVVLAALAVAVIVGAVSASGPSGYLQPGSADPDGAMALRNLLEQQGVQVTVVTSASTASQDAVRAVTLFVPDLQDLSDDDLALVSSVSADLVVTDPLGSDVPQLLPGMRAGHDDVDVITRDPACDLRAATQAGSALTGGVSFAGQPDGATLESCYAERGEGTVVRTTAADGRTVTVVGSGQGVTNADIGDDGNAALALNLLGGNRQLVWFAPSPAQTPPADGGTDFTDLLPRWVGIAVAQLVVAVLVAAAWRGRRLGPVVVEPLPVQVRAAETTEGRARLYRRRRARGRAADHLRAAALARLLAPLGLATGSSRDAVVTQVCTRSGWSGDQVLALLYGAAPQDDVGLVALASALDSLERQVRRQ